MDYKKVLVLAVGGGNDSVSTLLLQLQLNKSFNYNPEHIDIVAVLPDCLDYHNVDPTDHPLVVKINEFSQRSVNGKIIEAFPERILAQNKNIFSSLNLINVYGLSMKEGSFGISSALQHLVMKGEYDLILSIDVGGDFIADKGNLEVLSPMMDGFMLYALKDLKSFIQDNNLAADMLFSIFGLGTDGESTPDMLSSAMSLIPDIEEYSFCQNDVNDFIEFYRDTVEVNRYSRTTDYTIQEICGVKHDNPSNFRGRFHTHPSLDVGVKVYYGYFKHLQDEAFFGKYYLFKDIDLIDNIYSKGARSGIEWFLNVQTQDTKINHELNGQSYNRVGEILNCKELNETSLFFCTPSRKFSEDQQLEIIDDVSSGILNSSYDLAFIYKDYKVHLNHQIKIFDINSDISVIGLNSDVLKIFSQHLILHLKKSRQTFIEGK